MIKNEHVARDAHLDQAAYFRGKPRQAALLYAITLQLQELEDVTYDVINERLIDNAKGAQLETLGALVGEARLGRTDDEYRIAIRGRILANRSNGHQTDLRKLLELMLPGATYELSEYPIGVEIVTDAAAAFDETAVVYPFLVDAKAGGVEITLRGTASGGFRFSAAREFTNSSSRGFASISPPIAGGELGWAAT